MPKLDIKARIWLSVGVFLAGYVTSVVLNQAQSSSTERQMSNTAQVLFPAAQRSQNANAAFQRMTKSFGDAVMVEDAERLDRALQEAAEVQKELDSIASLTGIEAEHARAAAAAASSVGRLAADAGATYRAMLGGAAAMTPARPTGRCSAALPR